MAGRRRAAAKTKQVLHRCLAVTSVVNVEKEFSREFGKGAVVDLEEEVYPGTKLGELVRDGCFEPVEDGEAVEPAEAAHDDPAEPGEDEP